VPVCPGYTHGRRPYGRVAGEHSVPGVFNRQVTEPLDAGTSNEHVVT